MAKQVNRHDELRALLERLNLGGMAAVFADLALKAAKENISHEAYLFELGEHRGGAAHSTAHRRTPACFSPSRRQDLSHPQSGKALACPSASD